MNEEVHSRTEEDTWPPDMPNQFTPLVLIHHQRQHTKEQRTEIAKITHSGRIKDMVSGTGSAHDQRPLREILEGSTVTKNITEILAPLEKDEGPKNTRFVLIEGAPGIGKSMLMNEIAFMWSKKVQLRKYKLVLLIRLRDPNFQEVKFLDDILKCFCIGDRRAPQIAAACSKYLLQSGGRELAFLFDGYDEFPKELQSGSLIDNILRRKLLPKCGLVVSSRPHASENLRQNAKLIVDILGFTEQEQQLFIQQALEGQRQKICELQQYLDHHMTISNLCYVPFNMLVLLYLFNQGYLPNNSTELYNDFVCLTICRHLTRSGHGLDDTITELANLPESYKKIVKQLTKLSLEALNKDQLVFTLDEINAACPDIAATPGAINGFGLLQAVKHFGRTGKTMTFNFLHFSIQEFLAANHVANLSPSKELKVLEEKFWSNLHFNMFSMYISLTKGQHKSFKSFLSSGDNSVPICSIFLRDKLKCLHLYQCFHESGDKEFCESIEKGITFRDTDNRVISFSGIRLAPSDMERVAIFLASSSQREWLILSLYRCFIQDYGTRILHRGLIGHRIRFAELRFNWNSLTSACSPIISDFTISCRVKKLVISYNESVGEDEKLYAMLSNPSSMLEELEMDSTKLSSQGAIKLFTALAKGSKLKNLNVSRNHITDEACNAIATMMKRNTSLVKLWMYRNPFTVTAVSHVIEALQHNNTLEVIEVPECPKDIDSLINAVDRKRRERGSQLKLKVL